MSKAPKTLKEKMDGLPPDFNVTEILDEHHKVKRKYWFYWEEAVDAWIPAPDDLEAIVGNEDVLDVGFVDEIRLKIVEMTDHEYESMKEA